VKRLKKIWRKKGLKAHIDQVEEKRLLHGWALDPENLKRRIILEVLVDEQPVATVTADNYRPDLQQAFGGDGRHGFVVEMDLGGIRLDHGDVILREKTSRRPIPCNRVNVGIDPLWMQRVQHQYSEVFSDLGSDYGKLIAQESYAQLQHVIERHPEKDLQSSAGAVILLALYLGKEDFIEALALYRRIRIQGKSDIVQMADRILFDYASELWRHPPKEHIDARAIRRIELIQVVSKNASKETITPLYQEERFFENLAAYLLRSGRILPIETLEKLYFWTTGQEKFDSVYLLIFDNAGCLLRGIHQGDVGLIEELPNLLNAPEKNLRTTLWNAYHYLVLDYLELMTNREMIDAANSLKLNELLDSEIAPTFKDKLHIKVRRMEWFYLAGESWKALEIFRYFAEERIEYLDWKSKYFPELLWLYFLDEGERIDSRPLMDFLYHRLEEDRSSFVETIVLAADLLRWRKNAGLSTVQKVIKRAVEEVYTVEEPEQIQKAAEVIHRLTQGGYDDYFARALEIREAMQRSDYTLELRYHHAALFEDQNLFTLSLTAKHQEGCSRYRCLMEGSESPSSAPTPRKRHLVLIDFPLSAHKEKLLEYYRSVMPELALEGIEVLLIHEQEIRSLRWEDEEVTEKELPSKLAWPEAWDHLWLLDSHHLFHHASFRTPLERAIAIPGENADRWSYILGKEEWSEYRDRISDDLSEASLGEIRRILYEGITRFKIRSLQREEPAILSFKNVEGDALERLVDFERPLIEVDDLPKATRYLSALYADPRVEELCGINVNRTALIRIKSASLPLDENDLACFLVQRNERMRLEGFFDYYRRMGVSRFYVIDNASDDGETLDFLLDQEDVELYSTPQAYSQSLYGVRWAELLIKAKRVGRWNLVLDADELLVLDEKYPDLPTLCRELEAENLDALYTPFVDMYSDLPINQTPYRPGEAILEQCGYHDRTFYTTHVVYGGILGETPTYFGGVRSRAFGLDRVVLNKFPLFRYRPGLRLREGLHWIDHARFRMADGVLLHFKYLDTFHAYVEREIARGQHWNGASEYRKYHEMLRSNPEFSLYDPALSVRFSDVRRFYDVLSGGSGGEEY